MSVFDRIAEEKIRQAMREGKFDNLPGAGKPLPPEEFDPHEPVEQRLANSLLKQNGFLPPWLELRQEIEQEIGAARLELAQSADRPQAAQRFRERIDLVNRSIFRYNLQAPSPRFHMLPLHPERELNQITGGRGAPGDANSRPLE